MIDRPFFRCCNLSSDADAPAVAADRSTVVVAATGVKRIDRPHQSIDVVDLELRGSVIDNSTVSLLFFRYCPNPIAHADAAAAAAAAAADQFTAVIAVVAVVADAELNYDKLIGLLMLLIDTADPFFLAVDSNTKRIGVPPLLRTASATLCLWDCPY